MREMSADEVEEITQERAAKASRLAEASSQNHSEIEPEGYLRFTEAQKTDFHVICTMKELVTQYSCLNKNVTCFRSEVSSSTKITNNRENCKMLRKGFFIYPHHS